VCGRAGKSDRADPGLHADRSPFRPWPTTGAGPRPPQLSRSRFNFSISVSSWRKLAKRPEALLYVPSCTASCRRPNPGRTIALLLAMTNWPGGLASVFRHGHCFLAASQRCDRCN
jgi:hypothetical protein